MKRDKFPFEQSVSSKYGAPMGRHSDDIQAGTKVHLRQVPPVDYDYDPGGAYWGFGNGTLPLYCAFAEVNGAMLARYVRAKSREQAKDLLKEYRFYR